MSSTNLGKIPTCLFGNRLLIALDGRWIEKNNNKPLIFDVKIESGKLTLEAQITP